MEERCGNAGRWTPVENSRLAFTGNVARPRVFHRRPPPLEIANSAISTFPQRRRVILPTQPTRPCGARLSGFSPSASQAVPSAWTRGASLPKGESPIPFSFWINLQLKGRDSSSPRRAAIQLQVKTILNFVQHFAGFVCQQVRLHSHPERPRIDIILRPHSGIPRRCGRCQRPAPGYDCLAERSWQFVPLWGIPTFFFYSPRRALRANNDETVLLVLITEQGENRNQLEKQRNMFGLPHGFARRGTEGGRALRGRSQWSGGQNRRARAAHPGTARPGSRPHRQASSLHRRVQTGYPG